MKSHSQSHFDALPNLIKKIAPGNVLKFCPVERIQTDIYPVDTGGFNLIQVGFQRNAVGGKRQVRKAVKPA